MEQQLTTKLYIPTLRAELVHRPRLIERMNEGLNRKLTLVSAPAGFGKTTLVGEWVEKINLNSSKHNKCKYKIGWLSLDENDSDPVRLIAYIITALNQADGIGSDLGEKTWEMLQSPQQPPVESILTNLINEISTSPNNYILVLDDYHLLEARPVDEALTLLLEHLPPKMHLIIVTREDPQLPLSRLRAQGQLTELRVADLRFTPSEASEFLNQVMVLNLSAEEVAALETRTEGWIAGLQLAALSMRGREDIPLFIESFAGDNRYIIDYLVDEVLHRQPEQVRSFLMRTSILTRLYGPLCDAVTGQEDGRRMLVGLERDNLFVIPLDENRQWYRYHHLFADVLKARLIEEQPEQVPALHQRASEWYEHNGFPGEAIHHALVAEDFERAAGLIELAWPEMDSSFQSETWLGWANRLPNELARTRPVLSVAYAWGLLNIGQLEEAELRLQEWEGWLDAGADMYEHQEAQTAEMVVVDEEQFRSLPISIASARAYLAQTYGDVPGTIKYAGQAFDLLPEEDYFGRGRAAVILGLAYWSSGDLEIAYRTFMDAMTSFLKAGNILYAISFTFILADIRLAQGRLNEAIRTYEHSLRMVMEQGEPELKETAMLYLGLSELYREQGNVESANQYLRRSKEMGDQSEVYQYRLCRAQARIKEAHGDLESALQLLDQAEKWLYYENPIPDLRPAQAWKAQVWMAQGRLADAEDWAHARGLTVDDDLNYLQEFEHLTLARLLIARYEKDEIDRFIHEAVDLLERLLDEAEDGGRTGSAIKILVLQALAFQAQDDSYFALASLERALVLAEPEGFVRIFVDEGQPIADLLIEAESKGIMQEYTAKLLTALEFEALTSEDESYPSDTQPLIEPLSQRELEVLQLIALGLSNREISERLFLSLNTVKGHNRNIFAKLGVHRRTEAVARARELNLL